MDKPHRSSFAVGIAAALGAAALATSWQIATRAGASSALGPLDLALLRYTVPGLVLLPILLRQGLWPSAASRWLFVPIFAGAGIPFGLLAIWGTRYAPVAHMGALMPGTMPLFTALLAALLLGERPGRLAQAGLALIVFGVGAIAGGSLATASDGAWRGDLLFLAAAILWSVFTVAYRHSAIDAWHLSALLACASSLVAIPLWVVGAGDGFASASFGDIALQIAMQGLVAGLAGTWTYALAVRHLGAGRAALSGALVPALSALGGWLLLAETPALSTVAGIVLTVAGIACAVAPKRD